MREDAINSNQKQILDAAVGAVRYFRPAVLAQYRAESHKYELLISDFEGKVKLSSDYWESIDDDQRKADAINIRFGFRKHQSGEYLLAVFVPDFQAYSKGHLDRWLPYLVDDDEMAELPDLRFESWALRHLLGSWEIESNVLDRLVERVRFINALSKEAFGTSLFASESNPNLHAPISENTHAYEDAHREASGLLIDALDGPTVAKLVERTGAETAKTDRYTVQLLKRGFPSATRLWDALDVVSAQRRKAAHNVRPPAKPFSAFETFCGDLEDVVMGLGDLQAELETLLGAMGKNAMKRQHAIDAIPKSEGPPHPASGIIASTLRQLAGKTIESVTLSQRENYEDVHRSELIELRFTDGSSVFIETHTNVQNVAADHGDFDPTELNVCLYAHYVPPPTT